MGNNILTGQLCCGFVKTDIVLGNRASVAPPCVETEFQILNDSVRQWLDPVSDWSPGAANAGGSSVNTGALVVPNNDGSINLTDTYVAGAALAGFDESKDYTFSFNFINNTPENFAQIFSAVVTLQSATRYVDINLKFLSTGINSVNVGVPSTWTLGQSPQWASLATPFAADSILFTLVSLGFPFDGFTVGTMALTYIECI